MPIFFPFPQQYWTNKTKPKRSCYKVLIFRTWKGVSACPLCGGDQRRARCLQRAEARAARLDSLQAKPASSQEGGGRGPGFLNSRPGPGPSLPGISSCQCPAPARGPLSSPDAPGVWGGFMSLLDRPASWGPCVQHAHTHQGFRAQLTTASDCRLPPAVQSPQRWYWFIYKNPQQTNHIP